MVIQRQGERGLRRTNNQIRSASGEFVPYTSSALQWLRRITFTLAVRYYLYISSSLLTGWRPSIMTLCSASGPHLDILASVLSPRRRHFVPPRSPRLVVPGEPPPSSLLISRSGLASLLTCLLLGLGLVALPSVDAVSMTGRTGTGF